MAGAGTSPPTVIGSTRSRDLATVLFSGGHRSVDPLTNMLRSSTVARTPAFDHSPDESKAAVADGRGRADDIPNFVIIGAARSGTTSLYRYLAQHPDVFTSPSRRRTFSLGRPSGRSRAGAAPEQMYPIRSAAAYRALFADVLGQARHRRGVTPVSACPGVPERSRPSSRPAPGRDLAGTGTPRLRRLFGEAAQGHREPQLRGVDRGRGASACTPRLRPAAGRSCTMGSIMPICGDGSRLCRTIGYWCCCTTISPPIRATSSRGSAGSSVSQRFPRRTARSGMARPDWRGARPSIGCSMAASRGRPAACCRRWCAGRLGGSSGGPDGRIPAAPRCRAVCALRLAELYHDDILALGKLIGRDLGTWPPNFHDREPHRIESGPAVGELRA